jgi:hypothetical protein
VPQSSLSNFTLHTAVAILGKTLDNVLALEPHSWRVFYGLDRHLVAYEGSNVVDAVSGQEVPGTVCKMRSGTLRSPNHGRPFQTQTPAVNTDVFR